MLCAWETVTDCVLCREDDSLLSRLPSPTELCRLQGHRHDVLLLQFSHNSKSIATGAKDGSVRVRSPLAVFYFPARKPLSHAPSSSAEGGLCGHSSREATFWCECTDMEAAAQGPRSDQHVGGDSGAVVSCGRCGSCQCAAAAARAPDQLHQPGRLDAR